MKITPVWWGKFDPLEKATFLAQWATILALLATVGFSFFTLRAANLAVDEAKGARADQLEFFMGEKAPHVDVSVVEIDAAGAMTARLLNGGESTAKEIQAYIGFTAGRDKTILPLPTRINLPAKFSLEKNQAQTVRLAYSVEIAERLRYRPSGVQVLSDHEPFDVLMPFYIVVRYLDIQRITHEQITKIVFSK